METRRLFVTMVLAAWALWPGAPSADAQQKKSIGHVTAVQPRVEVMHEGESGVSTVNLGTSVLFKDTYETRSRARLKLLFDDDSILSLGEKTKIQITESVYDPTQGKRSTIIRMLNGSLRALVGKVFGGPGSKFEIHAPTAAAAARGTYFIVWTAFRGKTELTGVLNIGETGKVSVANIDPAVVGSVLLNQNEYTLVEKGKPPSPPAAAGHDRLNERLDATETPDQAVFLIPGGNEDPGADVSKIKVTPFVPNPRAAGPTNTEPQIPTVPPIDQQPARESTPVSVEVNFP